LEHLSNIELYYALPQNIKDGIVKLTGDESGHIARVMRHTEGDTIYVTNGEGKIYRTVIRQADKENVFSEIEEQYVYQNNNTNKIFCIPRLKNPERFEFALEKSVELGITSFIVFECKRTIAKGEKIDRWKKILLSAMKQSLRSFMPEITYVKSLKHIAALEGQKLVFEQNSKRHLRDVAFDPELKYYFVFGPEGGLDDSELELFGSDCFYEIGENRLRSETAIIKAAALAG